MLNPGYPGASFLGMGMAKTGSLYASFLMFEEHFTIKRPNQCPMNAIVRYDPQREKLLDFLLKDAEEMSRRVNLPIADMTTSPPRDSSRGTVSDYLFYLSNLYFSS